MFKVFALTLLLAAPVIVHGEDPNGAPKPGPPPPHDKPDGEHKPHFGGSQYHGPGGMGSMSGFDKLSEGERKRVRDATDVALKKPEMQAAKEKFMKASEEFRAALRDTLQSIDPEVVKIMEKVKPAMPWEMRNGPPPVSPEDPEFAKHAVARLGFELTAFSGPDRRDAMRRLHDRLVELPIVKEAITKLQAAPVGERMDAFKTVREVYRKEFEKQIEEYRKKQAADAPK